MKKQYSTPDAVKIEFNYTEAVVACSNARKTTTAETYNNAAPGSGGWGCACEQSSWWIDAATGLCKKD